MLGDPLSVTVGSDTISLARINNDNFAATYYGVSTDGLRRYTMTTKHTIPTGNQVAESHLIRLDRETVDSNGVYVRTDTVWFVPKCSGAAQIAGNLIDMYTGLTGLMEASSNDILTKLLNRNP